MQHLTDLVVRICSLRTLVALTAVWLLAHAPQPQWFRHAQELVQAHLFRLGLHLSDLPSPQTELTIVHVPDTDYERWLADLPGASSLTQLLQAGDERTVYGLVLERPLSLLQPAAETLLRDIPAGRLREPQVREIEALLARRDTLVSALRSPQLVLGLTDQSSHLYRRIPVKESFADYPQPLRDWLWPWPDPPPATVLSPVLQYFPLDSAVRQGERLALLEGDRVIPTFPLRFWSVAHRFGPGPLAEVEPLLHWQRDTGFVQGLARISTSPRGYVVPVYGPMSEIRASMRQISLAAALSGGLSGGVLIGRDGSAVLEQAGQVIASLGDSAFLFEPVWWSAAHKGLLGSYTLLLLLGIRRLPLRLLLGLAGVCLVGATVLQVAGQVVAGWWLPVGDLLVFGLLALPAMFVSRWQLRAQTRVLERADRAQLALAESCIATGQLDIAWHYTRECRSSTPVLECLYQIADSHEVNGDYAAAFAVLQDLRRRRRRFRDVPERLKRLRACLVYKEQRPPEPEVLPSDAVVAAS